MPLVNAYAHAYLAPQVTVAREPQAAADVAMLGAFPAAWVTRLTILRACIIVCTECLKSPDDVFVSKLSAYRKKFARGAADRRCPLGQHLLLRISGDHRR